MPFDYFYGTEGEHFRFYQIPAVMLEDKNYNSLSARAKLLYGVLLSLVSLSRLNHWIEEDTNRVYVICPQKEMASKLGCSLRTVTSIIDELKDFGLIERKKQGQGRPELIFVKNFATGFIKEEITYSGQIFDDSDVHEDSIQNLETVGHEVISDAQKLRVWEQTDIKSVTGPDLVENDETDRKSGFETQRETMPDSDAQNLRVKTRKNCVSRDAKIACQDAQNLHANYINNNYLNRVNRAIYTPSIHQADRNVAAEEKTDMTEQIKEQIDYLVLLHDRPENRTLLDCLVKLMAEVCVSRKKSLYLAGEEHVTAEVQERFRTLNMEHMRYILSCLEANQTKIKNVRQYMLTTLYHAPVTEGSYYQLLVQHHDHANSS